MPNDFTCRNGTLRLFAERKETKLVKEIYTERLKLSFYTLKRFLRYFSAYPLGHYQSTCLISAVISRKNCASFDIVEV